MIVESGSPVTEADWRRVADMLRRLYRSTQGGPQRRGWRSLTELVHTETGTRIDLGVMPSDDALRDSDQLGRGSSNVRSASPTATPNDATGGVYDIATQAPAARPPAAGIRACHQAACRCSSGLSSDRGSMAFKGRPHRPRLQSKSAAPWIWVGSTAIGETRVTSSFQNRGSMRCELSGYGMGRHPAACRRRRT